MTRNIFETNPFSYFFYKFAPKV